MVERGNRLLEYEDRPGEYFGILHIHIPIVCRFLPREASRHLRNAAREGLLALRSLLDEALEGRQGR